MNRNGFWLSACIFLTNCQRNTQYFHLKLTSGKDRKENKSKPRTNSFSSILPNAFHCVDAFMIIRTYLIDCVFSTIHDEIIVNPNKENIYELIFDNIRNSISLIRKITLNNIEQNKKYAEAIITYKARINTIEYLFNSKGLAMKVSNYLENLNTPFEEKIPSAISKMIKVDIYELKDKIHRNYLKKEVTLTKNNHNKIY